MFILIAIYFHVCHADTGFRVHTTPSKGVNSYSDTGIATIASDLLLLSRYERRFELLRKLAAEGDAVDNFGFEA